MSETAKTLKYKALQDALETKFRKLHPNYFNGSLRSSTAYLLMDIRIGVELGKFLQSVLDYYEVETDEISQEQQIALNAAAGRMLCYLCIKASLEGKPFVIPTERTQKDASSEVLILDWTRDLSVRAFAVCQLGYLATPGVDAERAFLIEADKILGQPEKTE